MKHLLIIPAVLSVLAGSAAAGVTPPDAEGGMRFLEYVTGVLPEAEEKDWWDVGRYQHGPDAKRYHIAFAGYAAAALAQASGDAATRARAGVVLSNCVERMLRRDVWAYTQSPKRWGKKPWAPDPCYRENIMYTGHLLQLLAYYERLTGDKRYWETGFDFDWWGKKVHYDVAKLIDVTVAQMRTNDCGGVSCEPGLVFFPCNNHPQIALKIFAALGHGDWTADTAKWEKWALANYKGPLFGGGAVKYFHHQGTGMKYPRGTPGLDGWSALWYEPWAADRKTARALWKEVLGHIDWDDYASPTGACKGGGGCCDPAPVPTAVSAVFLAAAARTCDDAVSAERFEKAVDAKFLKREKDFFYLDVDRSWRIGATAVRIQSLAVSLGARMRDFR